jgi:uncharacterized membrane protein YwzB
VWDRGAIILEFETWCGTFGVVEENEVVAVVWRRYIIPVHRGSDELAVSRVPSLGSLLGLGLFVGGATFWRLVVLIATAFADNFGAMSGEISFVWWTLVSINVGLALRCRGRVESIQCTMVFLFVCLGKCHSRRPRVSLAQQVLQILWFFFSSRGTRTRWRS